MRRMAASGAHHYANLPAMDWMGRVSLKQRRGMLAALAGWLNTRELGEICVRGSGNAAERECRHAAERLGFHWLKLGVNEQETEEVELRYADHCLYAMCWPGQRPPRHRALSEETWLALCRQVGYLQPHLDRTAKVVADVKSGKPLDDAMRDAQMKLEV